MTSNYSGQLPQWLENNKKYASEVFPTLPTPWSMGPQRQMVKPTGQATFVLTCLDPRCVPEQYFGPDFAGGVMRNAGGRATDDVVKSIAALRGVVGVKTVAVVHHTDCGMTHVDRKEIIDTIAESGPEAKAAAEKIDDYMLFSSDEIESSVRDDVRSLRKEAILAGVNIHGFKLDTFTGEITPVDV